MKSALEKYGFYEKVLKIIDESPDVEARDLFDEWINTCPFDFEASDEFENETDVCLWYYFRIPSEPETPSEEFHRLADEGDHKRS